MRTRGFVEEVRMEERLEEQGGYELWKRGSIVVTC